VPAMRSLPVPSRACPACLNVSRVSRGCVSLVDLAGAKVNNGWDGGVCGSSNAICFCLGFPTRFPPIAPLTLDQL
jgi:hypothetical protein